MLQKKTTMSKLIPTEISTNIITENIEITSALVVIDFSNWKGDAIDPTESVDNEKLMTLGAGLKGNAGMGLRGYIEHIDTIKKSRNSDHTAA